MRKLFVSSMISVDGYFADKDGNIDWHVVEDEFNKHSIETLSNVDTILFGRITYELFESYWPKVTDDSATVEDDRTIGRMINEATKIVCSETPRELTWQNSKQLTNLTAEAVKQLKDQPGKDIVVYGSGTIVKQLTDMGLVDEYHLFVAPVILGDGKSLFAGVKDRHKLELIHSSTFKSGVAVLQYRPL